MPRKITHAVLLPGFAETPDRYWLPWLHRELELRGIGVIAPRLPNPLRPELKAWMHRVAPLAKTWGPGTVLIGHSLGGVLALRMLEHAVERRVLGCVLVSAPFASTISLKNITSFFSAPVDWYHLRHAARTIVAIHAKDDPLIPYDHALRYAEALECETHVLPHGGHFAQKKAPAVLGALHQWLD